MSGEVPLINGHKPPALSHASGLAWDVPLDGDGVSAARLHVKATRHDLALKSRVSSSCAECDWRWPIYGEEEP